MVIYLCIHLLNGMRIKTIRMYENMGSILKQLNMHLSIPKELLRKISPIAQTSSVITALVK